MALVSLEVQHIHTGASLPVETILWFNDLSLGYSKERYFDYKLACGLMQ